VEIALFNHESGAVFGWCVMNIDITEQRQAKTGLAAGEHELSLIIETIPAFAWFTSMLAVLLLLTSPCFAQSVPTQAPPTASAPQRPAYSAKRRRIRTKRRPAAHPECPRFIFRISCRNLLIILSF
jgi:hypothetical protein